jgi:hypothetical protein
MIIVNQGSRGRAFTTIKKEASTSDDVANGTFLVNTRYASILFDSGADKCFISLEFKPYLLKPRTDFEEPLSVEVASGKTVETKPIIQDCSINT